MKLVFIRHGKAADPQGNDFQNDFVRPLTKEGRDEIENETKWLAKLKFKIDHVCSSPLVRARQTAEIMVAGLGYKDSITISDLLQPGANFEDLAQLLAEFPTDSNILLVSHEPACSSLIQQLISSGRSQVEMKKGALALVESEQPIRRGGGRLIWLVSPKLLLNI